MEKTKSNFGGIDREIYKFHIQKLCETFKNSCTCSLKKASSVTFQKQQKIDFSVVAVVVKITG